jgi:hypothetical protein
MTESLLKLGSFSFEGLESPERILVTSKQRIALHHLGSGFSEADCLGEDCGSVTFQGIFTGARAEERIRALELLKLQSNSLALTWHSKTLLVIIQELELNYSSTRWIPYKLRCVVIGSNTRNAVLASPDTQVGEMIGLMQHTGLSPTSAQTIAILNLAAMNYDVVPSDELQQAEALISEIDSQIATFENMTSLGFDNDTIAESPVIQIATTVANSGSLASLFLARNRLMNITVRAESVIQP